MTQHRILIVDDEPDVRTVIELTLSREPDFAIRTCASGKLALAEAASWSPDLIVLDVMMPGMDGPTTLGHLRADAATAHIPAVFLTARARPTELAHFISLGALGAIAKPFVPRQLRNAIKGYLQAAAGTRDAGDGRSTTPTVRAESREGPQPGPLMSDTELAAQRRDYLTRLQATVAMLVRLKGALEREPSSAAVLDELRTVAHRTAGSAGLYGFGEVSTAAAKLEDSIIAQQTAKRALPRIDADLAALVSTIGREPAVAP
jgi:CheY-like chemotaxis protein/HPt (histidine-containing phosphotransfer) domain-containing protein